MGLKFDLTAFLNRSLLSFSIKHKPCSQVGNFLPFEKMLIGQSHQHSYPSWKQSSHSIARFQPISTIFWKGKKSILTLLQKIDEMCNTIHWDNSHQTKLASHDTPGIWVGYAEGHSLGTHHIFDPMMKKTLSVRGHVFPREVICWVEQG